MDIKHYDITIVGNGIIGYSIAYALLQEDPNLTISIIGPKSHEGGASTAAGAMLNCFAEVTSLTLKSEAGREKFKICLEALKMWPKWLEGINSKLPSPAKINITNGTFVVHNARSGNLDSLNYNAIVKALNEYTEPFETVSIDQIDGFNPIDDARSLDAIYLPNEGYLNPHIILDAFETIFLQSHKVDLIDDLALSIEYKKGIFTVKTTKDLFISKNLVIAAGSYSQTLLDQFPEISKNIPRLFSGVGYSLIMEGNPNKKIKHVIRTPNRSGACGLHALPSGNNIYIGASNNVFPSPEMHVSSGLAHFLLECALEQIDQDLYKSKILKWQVGNRPASLDTYPLIGETSIPGLWLISGTYRDGFHQSPLICSHIAKQITGKKGLIEHNIFSPERKLIKTMNSQESIIEAIEHYMSGAYERGMKLPKAGWDPLLRELFTERLEKLYIELGTDFGLSPDMLIMFEFAPDRQKLIDLLRSYLP